MSEAEHLFKHLFLLFLERAYLYSLLVFLFCSSIEFLRTFISKEMFSLSLVANIFTSSVFAFYLIYGILAIQKYFKLYVM